MSYIALLKTAFIRVPKGIIPLMYMASDEAWESRSGRRVVFPITGWSMPTEKTCEILSTFEVYQLATTFYYVGSANCLTHKIKSHYNNEDFFSGEEAYNYILKAFHKAKTVEEYRASGKVILIEEYDEMDTYTLSSDNNLDQVSFHYKDKKYGFNKKCITTATQLVNETTKKVSNNFVHKNITVEDA